MTKRMLIDAAHQEEIRVALIDGTKVEDYDFESASRKPLRGNIYLARVTRVEPSLQAAFVEYGGNRHGFLAFNEIHPDYYQIPVSDREILQAAEAEEASLGAELELARNGDDDDDDEFDPEVTDVEDDDSDPENDQPASVNRVHIVHDAESDDQDASADAIKSEDDEAEEGHEESRSQDPEDEPLDDEPPSESRDKIAEMASEPANEISTSTEFGEESDDLEHFDNVDDPETLVTQNDASSDVSEEDEEDEEDSKVETHTKDREPSNAKKQSHKADLLERYREARRKRARLIRNYKIQEVVKRRQILLIQVVKEERGNKGAALTTYISLAGRYCVLMPNTARGGGISRKIPIASDRRRLKKVVEGLDVPQGMGLIIRTAGAKRTKAEIKRDYEYLLRLWENIRALTLESIAPSLIYEEASLIKRAIRDLYDKDISQVLVEGDAGYREAKDFMKMLMPSHAKNVQPYKEKSPLFLKYGVESQLDAMYQPTVRLKSGGYLVIHQTEALIAIDVNSGKATRERNIELTALKTNIEAAHEAARQCRMRDLAGLIVIDFIDMEEPKNNRTVERKLKEALKVDRARLQAGRISSFGLLEMSRQRRRSGIIDGTTHTCPTCAGAGVVRSFDMAALRILRAIEGEALAGKAGVITVRASFDVAFFILNHKRDWLKRIEDDYGVTVELAADETKAGDLYDIEKRGVPREIVEDKSVVRADQPDIVDDPKDQTEPSVEEVVEADSEEVPGVRKKRRRRRRRREEPSPVDDVAASETESAETIESKITGGEGADGATVELDEDGKPKRRRRRGRRGGRRNRRGDENPTGEEQTRVESGSGASTEEKDTPISPPKKNGVDAIDDGEKEIAIDREKVQDLLPTSNALSSTPPAKPVAAKKATKSHPENSTGSEPPKTLIPAKAPDVEAPPESETPSRKGWWQRALGG